MGARTQITIAQISDTQFGRNNAFGEAGLLPSDREFDSLASRLVDDLKYLGNEYQLRPDILVLSGDLTEWGMQTEFKRFGTFVDTLLQQLMIDRRRVVMVPGNHDVNRSACEAYFADCKAKGKAPERPYWPKLRCYAAFFKKFYRGVPGREFSQRQMWTLFEMPDLGVVIAGLNSDMAESHLDADHHGWVGEEQVRWFADRLDRYQRNGWLRVGVVHHNIVRGVVSDDENLRDANVLTDGMGKKLNLLLHGHTHNGGAVQVVNGLAILSTGSAGVVASARPRETPNQYQIVQISSHRIKQWGRAYFIHREPPKWGGDVRVSAELDRITREEALALDAVHGALAATSAAAEDRWDTSAPETSDRAARGGPAVAFSDHCVVDVRDLHGLDDVGSSGPRLTWHAKIQACFELIERMRATLDASIRRHPQWEATSDRSSYLAWMKSAFLDRYEALVSARDTVHDRAGRALFPALAGATLELRREAVSTFATLAALVVIRKLQAFEGYLVTEAGQLVLRLFPDLPEVPDWLVELAPYRSRVGWLAFRTRGFLLCRVGPSESSYEYLVLPQREAERLQEEGPLPDPEYFKWVVPQWILYGYSRPLERDSTIWVLTDARNRERWSRHRESPWAQEQSAEQSERQVSRPRGARHRDGGTAGMVRLDPAYPSTQGL